jgi:hypothetical protein
MDSEQVKILKQSVEAFNNFRKENPSVKIHLERATLLRHRLAGINLEGANLEESVLSDAVFDNAILEKAIFDRADITNASFIKAKMSKVVLKNAKLKRSIFERAILTKADCRGADFSLSEMAGADLGGCDLRNANFSGADLTGANLANAKLNGANFRDAKIEGTILAENSKLLSEAEKSGVVQELANEMVDPDTQNKAKIKIAIAIVFVVIIINLLFYLPGYINRKAIENESKDLKIAYIEEKPNGSTYRLEGEVINDRSKPIQKVDLLVYYNWTSEKGVPVFYEVKVDLENLQPQERRKFSKDLAADWKVGSPRSVIIKEAGKS